MNSIRNAYMRIRSEPLHQTLLTFFDVVNIGNFIQLDRWQKKRKREEEEVEKKGSINKFQEASKKLLGTPNKILFLMLNV